MTLIIILSLLFLISCEPKHDLTVKEKMTQAHITHFNSLILEEQILMERCLENRSSQHINYSYCVERMIEMRRTSIAQKQNNGSSILNTAVGTAVGIGASKLIFGKGK